MGKRQYPIHGGLKTRGDLVQPDENDTADTVLITGNVLGGTQGGSPEWLDNQNGIRDDPDEEVLNDEDDNAQPGWQVAALTHQGTDYIVDSKDYFINFEILVSEEYLDVVPSSASPDNVPPRSNRTLIGPYSWFVNEKGIVDSLLFSFPTTENVGFQDVFPSQKQPEAPPLPLLLYVVDGSRGGSPDSEVWIYDTATSNFVEMEFLDEDNEASTGITTDGVSFWTVNERGVETAYKYNSSFNPIDGSDFGLDNANADPEGITVLGTTAWVVDGADDKVYVYDLTNPTSVGSWDLCSPAGSCPADAPSENKNPLGIATDGFSIFVVDNNKFVFEYDMFGTVVGGFDLESGSGNPRGITTNGSFIWVLAKSTEQIRMYNMSGVYQQGEDISLQGGNDKSEGITVTPRLAN